MLIAITRQVSPAIGKCELTHLARQPIDVDVARAQHHQYEAALKFLGVEVHSLPVEAELPDSVFVEDIAIVVDEAAVITRPGVDSRKPETESIAQALAPYRKLFYIQAPGTLDGGDVLTVRKDIYVGLSSRSNQAAIEQMGAFLAPFDYTVKGVKVSGCLHLKSAVTQVAADTLLVNPAWVNKDNFPGMKFIEVEPSEAYAANAVLIGSVVIYPSSYPKTHQRLEEAGIRLVTVDAFELAKAEGAVTCCSLIFKSAGAMQ
jgi:dimethylargininase